KYPEDTFQIDDKAWRDRFSNRKLIPPPYTLTLPLEEVTIAEYLKQEGYHTGMVGKWHVAPHHQHYKGWSPTHGPKQQGFEWAVETFGAHPYGLSGKQRNQSFSSADGVFPLDSVTINAIDFLRSRKKEKKPFFLFVSHYFVHTPLDSRIDWLIAKYAKKSGGKYDQKVVAYAAFIEMLDHYVGQLLNELHAQGLAENTLVLFTSDNGGHPQHAFNRPLRGSKWNLYEGGVRVPMIASWPDRIPKNSISETPVIQTDYLPTFLDIVRNKAIDLNLDGVSILEVLKGKEPDQIKDRALIWHFPYYHPEGQKFDMAKDSISIEDGYISKTYPQSAIRMNNKKLIYFYEEERYEYYDLTNDPSEQQDLSIREPKKANQMKTELFEKLNKTGARFLEENEITLSSGE
ncbi:MAG: sulfatase-like hydrolase/transferase, partial [Bacteroidota bacterium]